MLNIINNKVNKKLKSKFFSVGIDFGTTYSLIGFLLNKKIIILSGKDENSLLPSVVCYDKNTLVVGEEATKITKENFLRTIFSVKRLLGKSVEEIKNLYPNIPYIFSFQKEKGICIETVQGKVPIVKIISAIITNLVKQSEFFLQKKIDTAVITVPSYFDDIQRKKIKSAAMLSGLKNIRLLNEPTAAAIAYGFHTKKNGIVLVYDLGGGTFDISILKIKKGIFEVLSTSGDPQLGGDDFDEILSKYIEKKNNICTTDNLFLKRKLLILAKNIKLKLSKEKKVSVKFKCWKVEISRSEFETLIEPLINKTLILIKYAIKDAFIHKKEVENVLMVGGSSYIPLIKRKLSYFFQKEIDSAISPDKAVVMGATIQSDLLFNYKETSLDKKNKFILLDVVPFSLGIELMGGRVEKIIKKNSTIPISIKKEFTTFKKNQTVIMIHILQGEDNFVKNCRSLGKFFLRGIKEEEAGKPRILVEFNVDESGFLEVNASDKKTNMSASIKVDFLHTIL
ncbi:Hsp70 family protein [Buchnera aphidicola (Mindarus keteleerifoliae)]|uniref:Hsp70 family protein n=1 Tax=Buchnera aphidicola TaxID=9 RepID=UPI0031B6A092